jgi:ParB family chromosome partitioning protein
MESLSAYQQESVERELIDAGRAIESRSCDDKWELGRLASEFVTNHRLGSDQKYADVIGSQQQRVNECRRVWEERQSYRSSGNPAWTHLRISLGWDDADQILTWAGATSATVIDMKAYRRAIRGEDLNAEPDPVKPPTQQAPEPNEPIVQPITDEPVPSGEVQQSARMPAAPAGNSENDSAAPERSDLSPPAEPSRPHVVNNSGEYEWYTPKEIVDLAREVMCGIDLDPASCETANKIVQASEFYDQEQNGLEQEWSGAVWLNPPYAAGLVGDFVEKLLIDIDGGAVEQACVLVNNATETRWFQALADKCNAICFPRKRIKFWNPGRELATGLQGQAVLYFGYRTTPFRDLFSGQGVTVSR